MLGAYEGLNTSFHQADRGVIEVVLQRLWIHAQHSATGHSGLNSAGTPVFSSPSPPTKPVEV